MSAERTFEHVRFFDEPEVRKRWLIYAILECGSAQACSEAPCCWSRKGKNAVLWLGEEKNAWVETDKSSSFKFDVSGSSSELTVCLFDRKLDAPTGHQEVTSLGWIKLRPVLGTWVSGEQWVDVQGGTGRVELQVSYLEKKVLPLEDRAVWHVCQEVCFGDLVRVKKSDPDRILL